MERRPEPAWRPEALFFDFDGVLVDTETVWMACAADFCAACRAAVSRERLLACLGDGDVGLLAYLTGLSGMEEAAVLADLRQRFQAASAGLGLRPGVAAYLDYGRRQGLPMALVSNSRRAYLEGWLARLHLTGVFTRVVAGDEPGAVLKPAPDLYRRALEALGIRAGSVLAFEDSPVGLEAAAAAGVRPVAFPHAISRPLVEPLAAYCVDLAAVSPEDLIAWVGRERGAAAPGPDRLETPL